VGQQTGALSPNLEVIRQQVTASLANVSAVHAALRPVAEPLARLAGKLGIAERAA
jgi:hypothetical protein